jgi:hypothetical protein
MKVLYFGETYASQDVRRQNEKSVIKQKISESFLLYNTDKAASFSGIYRREIECETMFHQVLYHTHVI